MSDKTRVIFVDDEPNVLAAIRRMLRSKRNEWDMEFAESGAIALSLFEEQVFDVIVSDIRMPNMDGAELLHMIKDNYPGVVRIALSGQVDLAEVIRSIRAVHQYISKPCEAEELIQKIEGALISRTVLTDPQMQSIVTEIDSLPVIPRVFQAIQDELKQPEPSIEKIAHYIAMDVGLVAKILKLVNSPYFALPRHIDSIMQAITMLGLETIQALVLSSHLFSMYDEKSIPNFSLELLWDHSFRVSNIACLIGQCEGLDRDTVVQARMAGLLHDVGKLILASNFPDKYQTVMKLISEKEAPINACEKDVFGTTHAQLGAFIMGLWGMSGDVVKAIGYHHSYNEYDLSVCMLVSIADVIDHQCVVLHPDYIRINFNKEILPQGKEGELMEKWINYINDHWEGMDDLETFDVERLFHRKG